MSKQYAYPPPFFQNRLVLLMDENNINGIQLAKMLGVDRKTIYKWWNGETSPNATQIYRLCNMLHTDADYLLGLTNQRKKRVAYINDDFEQAFNEMIVASYCKKRFGNNARFRKV